MQLIKKKTKLEFKAVDGVIKTTNNQNEKVSSSQKCTDMDKIVPEMLAVSAPIIENVLFCHQEESNWPMQEGNILKKKFDDVFESTRYTKALEAILKTKKRFQDKSKDLKVEMAEYGALLQASNETRQEIAVCEESIESCRDELGTNQERLDTITEKYNRTGKMIKEAEETESNLKELTIRVEESEKRVNDKRTSLSIIYQESNEELKNMLSNFDKAMSARTTEILSLQRNICLINEDISSKRIKCDELNVQKGQADSLNQLMTVEQVKLIEESANAARLCGLNPPSFGTSWSVLTTRHFIQDLKNRFQQIQREEEEGFVESRSMIQRLEQEVSEHQIAYQKLQIESSTKNNEYQKLISDASRKKIELTSLSSAKSVLKECEEELSNTKTAHKELVSLHEVKSSEYKRIIKVIIIKIII
jgi:DNA repair exonuclease SbcCD ATPase subunit